jgi:hemoglobin-like flavoprotein
MNEQMIVRLETSFQSLAPRGPELVDRFYANLFSRHPAVRPLFPREMSDQKMKLLGSLVLVIKNLRKPEQIEQPLFDMGRRHNDYGAAREHYPIVRDTLVEVMSEMAGPQWNSQLTSDWKQAIDFVSAAMLAAYDAKALPAAAARD